MPSPMDRLNYVRFGPPVGPGPGVAPDVNINAYAGGQAGAFGQSVSGQAQATATGVVLLIVAGIVLLAGWGKLRL